MYIYIHIYIHIYTPHNREIHIQMPRLRWLVPVVAPLKLCTKNVKHVQTFNDGEAWDEPQQPHRFTKGKGQEVKAKAPFREVFLDIWSMKD